VRVHVLLADLLVLLDINQKASGSYKVAVLDCGSRKRHIRDVLEDVSVLHHLLEGLVVEELLDLRVELFVLQEVGLLDELVHELLHDRFGLLLALASYEA